MSILCYLLVNYEETQQTDSSAGYIMLAMSEAGFLAVVIAFLIVAGKGFRILIRRASCGIRRSIESGCLGCLRARVPGVRCQGWLGSRELLAAPLLHGFAARLHSRAGRSDVESWPLRNRPIEWRSGSGHRNWTGISRAHRGKHHGLGWHSLCHDRERFENHARAQLDRERGHYRGGLWGVSGVSKFRKRRSRGDRSHGRPLSYGESFRLQGSAFSGSRPY